MFDTLTDAERMALRSKLADWGHEFAQVGHRLAGTANATEPFTPERNVLWGQAVRFYDTMTELHQLRAEVMTV